MSTKPKFVILHGEAAVKYAADQEFEELCARTNPSPAAREIMRANFIPSWERAPESEIERGRYIANSWPVGMATAVCRAMLVAIALR